MIDGPAARADRKPPEIVTVGRIVHYVPSIGARHLAAIVIATGENGIEDSCELWVFYPQRYHRLGFDNTQQSYVPFDPTGKIPHSWHWPERDNGLRATMPPAVEPTGIRISEEIVSGIPSKAITE